MTRFGYAIITQGAALLGCVTAFLTPLPRLVWNTTSSTPVGLYRIVRAHHVRAGDLVAILPPNALADWLARRGYVPRHVPLLKHVAAIEGQSVCRTGHTITIDGVVAGVARPRDHLGRSLPVWSGCRRIGRGELFVMNARVPDSLDGRYFGPIPAVGLFGRAVPLWTQASRSDLIRTGAHSGGRGS